MSFDHHQLARAVNAHGPVVRIVIVSAKGSAPRDVGTSMLVWRNGQSGTIGGGALEYDAVARARKLARDQVVMTMSLGPDLGQCCGGAVKLLLERFDLGGRPGPGPFARPLDPFDADGPPASVTRLLAAWEAGAAPKPTLIDGWFVEPEHHPANRLWIYGAGHVGRALVGIMEPLDGWALTWIDTATDRFPPDRPDRVACLPVQEPARAVATAPPDAHHLILTYSHDIDLALCHAVLSHGFASCGLIGSATKWARFRKRLGQLGHSDAQISRITCPIGDPQLGKHPQAIAVGVVARLLDKQMHKESAHSLRKAAP